MAKNRKTCVSTVIVAQWQPAHVPPGAKPVETYRNLTDFVRYHKEFSIDQINNDLSRKKQPYHNERVTLERCPILRHTKGFK